MTYVVARATGLGKSLLIKKQMAYAVIVTFIDFDPANFGDKQVIVDGKIAIKLKGIIYIEI